MKMASHDINGTEEMWASVVAFENPEIRREELLEKFEQFLAHFPRSEHTKRALEMVRILRQMIQEDEEQYDSTKKQLHNKNEPTVGDTAAVTEEWIAELIFRLRDQNGMQISGPGRCEIFFYPSHEEKTPAHKLAQIGFDAVPALIEALDDRRFSRSVGYQRDDCFSHYVLRVGDCARAILETIAAREFYRPSSTSSEMSTEAMAEDVKQKARAWWEQAQADGEKRVLIEGVERGDPNSPRQAQLLLVKYPDAALAAIHRGAAQTQDIWTGRRLIDLASEVKDDNDSSSSMHVVPFLLQQMQRASCLTWRVTAARGLMRRAHPDAVPAMIAEWKSLAAAGTDNDYDDGTKMLIGLLALSGSIKAIQALARGLEDRPVDVKLNVVEAFSPLGNSSLTKGDKSFMAAIEDLLIQALDDTEQRKGMSASWGGKQFSNPRIGDVAAHLLWVLWPAKYTFDIEASTNIRDQQRAELKNARGGAVKLAQPPSRAVADIFEYRIH